jgi:flagellar basal body-associated protein FliL
MIRQILPVVLVLMGLGAGAGAGLFLRPAPDRDDTAADVALVAKPATPETLPEYVKLANQFIVPVVEGGRITSMVIVSLSLEVTQGSTDQVFQREPKLRDVFLQMLFDHANTGGFRGSFTDAANLVILRANLLEAAKKILAEQVSNVLITDIVRQDS